MAQLPYACIWCTYVLVLSYFFSTYTNAFNIEDRIPLVKIGPKNSLFGLAVAEHHVNKEPSRMRDILFLVGAPRAMLDGSATVNVTRPGALYKCSVLSNNEECELVQIDQEPSTQELDSSQQWLGITVQSQKPGGRVIACGHRYTRRGTSDSKGIIWEELIGRCYELDRSVSGSVSDTHDPCEGKDSTPSQDSFGYCQAGTSMAFAPNSEEDIIIGTPGLFTWTGGIATKHLNPDDLFQDDTVWSQRKDGGSVHLNSYSGFSSAFADISGFKFVSGAPRANDTGSVIIYEKNGLSEYLSISEILSGERIASSFGYDLKVFDINSDGRDDLIVGAPQYYDREKKLGGAVYIYLNKGLPLLGPNYTSVLYGKLDSSFGNSITHLGDINMDGANDIAIGAPGDDNGIGRVYIYHGNSDPNLGVDKEPSQILKGSALNDTHSVEITGFGYSLSGSLDMDLNGYPDLTVGSLSDTAVLYRTRPIVNVQATLNPSVQKIDINTTTAPKKNIATFIIDGETVNVVTFNVSFCMNYTSIPTTFDDTIDVRYTLILDAEKVEQNLRARATFVPKNHTTYAITANLTLPKQSDNQEACDIKQVYLDNDMRDKLSPFVLSFKYELITLTPQVKTSGRLESLSKYPILNKNRPDTVVSKVNISKNCGDDEICHSNLTLKNEFVVLLKGKKSWEPLERNDENIPVLMVGSEEGFGIQANITNPSKGEDAHQAKFKLILPSLFRYSGIEPKTIRCVDNPENSSLVECSVGNPFRTNNVLSMIVKLENDKRLYDTDSFTVSMAISTSSVQESLGYHAYQVNVRKQVALHIDGYTNYDQIPFGGEVVGESAVTTPALAGLPVVHRYEVKNIGTTPVEHVNVKIDWPYSIENGKWLFYLLDVDNSRCDIPSAVRDPLHLVKEKSRPKREASTETETSSLKKSLNDDTPVSSPVLRCGEKAICVQINCTLDAIEADAKVYINVKGVTWNATFLEEFNGTTHVVVYSNASVEVNISNVEYANTSTLQARVQTTMLSETITKTQQPVELWIIVLACLGGVILLVFIVLLLWRCGFFKRNRDFGDYHKARKHRQASKKADEVSDRLVY